jgi:dolichol-phosphate mannosyltransferase
MTKNYDLALVMPVYNEEECISGVVKEWIEEFENIGLNFVMVVLNDGSKDNTAEVLKEFDTNERVLVINKANSGHGPTILEGYKKAVDLADWVFQCDSDGEMLASGFGLIWKERYSYDALFGYRDERVQNKGRAFISFVSRLVVKMLFGTGVKDVNTPYRLMKSDMLAEIIQTIPADTFAPNVLISGEFNRKTQKIFNTPIKHQHRRTGQVSIVKWKLWKSVIRSFFQTIKYKFRGKKQ